MAYEIKGGDTHELSTDINVITAEINAYQRVAGEAIFQIGKRLKHVKENEGMIHGEWSKWCETIGMDRASAHKFITVYEEMGDSYVSTFQHLGMSALYQIATMPEESRTVSHKIPSTGADKTVDEMTVRELREVKAELKKTQAERERAEADKEHAESRAKLAESQADVAIRSEELTRAQLEEFEGREPNVEIHTEYVEVVKVDASAVERLSKYEDRFGAIENYTEGAKSTNLAAVTTSVMTFSKEVRDLIKRHAFLIKYRESLDSLDPITRREYNETVNALQELVADFTKTEDRAEILDAKFTEI